MKTLPAISAILCMLGCSQSPTAPAPSKQISLGRVLWAFQNNPPDYQTYPLSVDVGVKYSGSELVWSDLKAATFGAGGVSWNLMSQPRWLNDSAKTIGYGWQNFYSTTFSYNGSVLPIDTFTFAVTLADGQVASETFQVPATGSTSTLGRKFLYTEDYTGEVAADFYPMIHRASIASASWSTDTLVVAFSVKDTSVFGGWLWFYDSAGAYIGKSDNFRNYTTKAMSETVGGLALHGDGLPNVAKASSSPSVMNAGRAFTETRSVRVVLTDGRQYATTAASWDCRSISSLAEVR